MDNPVSNFIDGRSVRLPVVDGHDWIRIGTELVLVGIAASVIAQVIHNVFG
jgi:Ni/Co efflux regulator RcnB